MNKVQQIFASVIAIYRKELQSYFASPFAYVVAAVFWFIGAIFFNTILSQLISELAFRDTVGATEPLDLPSQFMSIYLGILGSLSLFVLPILSMGLYTEERKRGTLELLATSPVTNWAVAVGKLLGVVTLFFTMTLPFMIYEAIALAAADPPMGFSQLWIGHLALTLLAAAVLSLGMFISSLTDSTFLAAILTFGVMLLLWVVEMVASNLQGPLASILGHLSLLRPYTEITQGILETSSLILFGSYIFLGIFLTAQSIEAFRFQRS
jgi:ABC-2 type transport system permease protein